MNGYCLDADWFKLEYGYVYNKELMAEPEAGSTGAGLQGEAEKQEKCRTLKEKIEAGHGRD